MISRFTPPHDLSPFKGYIFDCDGTLADTMPAHFYAWREALREGGAAFEFTWEIFLSRAGMSMERTVKELSDQFDRALDANFVSQRQRTLFHQLEKDIEPIDEVVQFARKMAKQFPIAVASGSARPSVERTLKGIGAEGLFPIIVTPEDVDNGKPAPDMFLLAAKKMGVSPEKCLVLEDAELGFEGARRAGMQYAVIASCPPAKEGS